MSLDFFLKSVPYKSMVGVLFNVFQIGSLDYHAPGNTVSQPNEPPRLTVMLHHEQAMPLYATRNSRYSRGAE